MTDATVHIAGPVQLDGTYQQCARCGEVLQDYTGREIAVAVDPDDPNPELSLPSWPAGKRIGVDGGFKWTYGDSLPLDADEKECKPTS